MPGYFLSTSRELKKKLNIDKQISQLRKYVIQLIGRTAQETK